MGPGMGTLIINKICASGTPSESCGHLWSPTPQWNPKITHHRSTCWWGALMRPGASTTGPSSTLLPQAQAKHTYLRGPQPPSICHQEQCHRISACPCPHPGQLNTNLCKLAINMVPFPCLHFFKPTWTPSHPGQPVGLCRDSAQAHTTDVQSQEHDGCLWTNPWLLLDLCHHLQGSHVHLESGQADTGHPEQARYHKHSILIHTYKTFKLTLKYQTTNKIKQCLELWTHFGNSTTTILFNTELKA